VRGRGGGGGVRFRDRVCAGLTGRITALRTGHTRIEHTSTGERSGERHVNGQRPKTAPGPLNLVLSYATPNRMM
jgi:hypothetical protein